MQSFLEIVQPLPDDVLVCGDIFTAKVFQDLCRFMLIHNVMIIITFCPIYNFITPWTGIFACYSTETTPSDSGFLPLKDADATFLLEAFIQSWINICDDTVPASAGVRQKLYAC